jgi:hypothetical protein
MSFLHPVLLGLLALAAVPVILHFMMRPRPKRLLFPALRLIESRRKTNIRRLRLRHLWLLLLRIAVIVLLVFAVARPLVPAANYGLSRSELLALIAVAAACIAGYFAALRWWGRQAAARHEYLYRRTLLRGGAGAVAALLVVLLVAWPYARRVGAEVADPTRILAEDRPVAAVFLFDTSRSMEYQFEGASRLDAARRIALAHLATLPAGSRVAVADSAGRTPVIFQADLAGAKDRIESLQTQAWHTPLEDRIRAAFDLQAADRDQGLGEQSAVPEELRRDPFVRAVYVFTDFAASAWSPTPGRTLRERLEAAKWLQLYLVDTGVENPVNVGLIAARPSEEITTAGSRVALRATLAAVGTVPPEATVELYVDGGSGPIKQGETTVRVEPGRANQAEFFLTNVTPPFVQGELRLVRSDPFAADDVRHFTVAVEPSPKILLVSDEADDAFIWGEALRARQFDVRHRLTPRLDSENLAEYDAVYLINAANPPAVAWERLAGYVRGGGGLGVVLGRRVESSVYNSEVAQAILPATLLTQIAFSPPEFFRPLDDGHPVFEKFQGNYGWLSNRDVRRHYVVQPNEGTSTIATYTDRDARPALVLRPVGGGRVALLTTGVDTGVDEGGWSDLPNAQWWYLAFADQLTQFLTGRSGGRRNFEIGEDVVLRLGQSHLPEQLLLRTPSLEQRPLDVPRESRRLTIRELTQIGDYELASPPGATRFSAGFSMNLPASESDFTRIRTEELDDRFGEGRYSLARDAQSLAVVVRDTTLGAELMPYVLMLLVAVFCGEQLVANRFYDEEQNPDHK